MAALSCNNYPEVSIHAPARGATQALAQPVAAQLVSIHAPARGATWSDSINTNTIKVSIHAPARGATHLGLLLVMPGFRFNPRAREGRDVGLPDPCMPPAEFQSTRPRGARPAPARWPCHRARVSIHAPARGATYPPNSPPECLGCFNPRAREGRDVGH